ncbi:MAG TPA: glutathione S-transferase N-terminal domain-containing protein [Casimicrobiaceae bacterium]|nr:glutathione S-transferase N-terminal domain-containing protein [Casimicrobiaceae bacterium]
MKLYSAKASPFGRKVRVVIIELGLAGRVETREQMPRDNSTGYWSINPLAKVPALQTDDGTVLYDSPVIVEFLNASANGSLIPAKGPERWDALRREAMGDGVIETAQLLRAELTRARELQSQELIDRQRATVNRTLDAAEKDPTLSQLAQPDVGAIAIGCALCWLDFRFPDWNWRPSRPRLAAWLQAIEQRPSFQSTRPD